MRIHRGHCFVGLAVVLALAAGPGCNKKSKQTSADTTGATGMSAQAMLAPEPDMAAQMAPPAPAPDMAAEAMAEAADVMKVSMGGPLKKGSARYNAALAELAAIDLPSGPDKMKPADIAYRCVGKECDSGSSGRDHLGSGSGFGGLDDRVKPAGKQGGATKTGKPTPKSRVSAFVPPVKISGDVANRVRAKIRARMYGLRRCHQQLLAKNPKAVGSVKISFVIATNGRVNTVRVSGALTAVIPCVKGKVTRWYLSKVPKSVPYGPFAVRFSIKK